MRVTILSPWVGTGMTADPRRARLDADFAGIVLADVTGTPAGQIEAPTGLVVVEAEAPPATLTAVRAAPGYAVLYDEGDRGTVPGAEEKVALESRLESLGLAKADVADALGDTSRADRQTLARRLADWLRRRQKE
jgi:hypothetical protein